MIVNVDVQALIIKNRKLIHYPHISQYVPVLFNKKIKSSKAIIFI